MSGSPGIAWSAGIINHGDFDDLERCLAALAAQSLRPVQTFVYDTGEARDRLRAIEASHPQVAFEIGSNRGYAGGANRVLDSLIGPEALHERDQAAELIEPRGSPSSDRTSSRLREPDFVLILNPDVELDPDYVAKLLAGLEGHPEVAISSGKLLRPGREVIDSAGIRFPRNRRPRDRGSEESARGRYLAAEMMDAVSGAALMLRVAALPDLSVEGQIFDEDFFAYHEDTDLCWRARNLGWQIRYVPTATAIHGRSWRRDRRFSMPVYVRRHSFKNHYLQIIKNEGLVDLLINLPWLVVWEVLRLGFVVVRDRPLARGYLDSFELWPAAFRKRRVIRAKMERRERGRSTD